MLNLVAGEIGHGPIVPIVCGSNDEALAAQAFLRARGFHVAAIRPPTVPVNEARLRLTVPANLDESVVVALERALGDLP